MDRTDVAGTRAFFGPRAADWEVRFPDDGPSYEQAVAELGLPLGAVVLDAACGTGRALPALRAAVGSAGTVIAVDLTVEMLTEATGRGRDALATLLLADVTMLPIATATLDGIFAAGLIPHLLDPVAGLSELARVCRAGARMALFHPLGRVGLAKRRGRDVDPDDVRAEHKIRPTLARAGWRCELVDDAADRYLVLATRALDATGA
jgi:SAM-dependent methyltransferase